MPPSNRECPDLAHRAWGRPSSRSVDHLPPFLRPSQPLLRPASTVPPTVAPPAATRRAPSLVLVATGDGKGKTTAAMGTVLRALSREWKVCVVQFLKSGKWKSGEARMLSDLGAEWHTMGDGFTWEVDDLEHSAEMARSAWAVAKEAIALRPLPAGRPGRDHVPGQLGLAAAR